MDRLDAFAEIARAYCDVVDRAVEMGRDAFLDAIEPKIAQLYTAGAELGDPSAFDGEGDEHKDTTEFFARLTPLSELLGDAAYFEEPMEVALDSAIAEIYEDVHRGVVLLERDRPQDAGYVFAFGFRYHWGRHAWEALAAIHSYRTGSWS